MASLHIDRPGIYSFFGSLLQLWCWSCWPRLIRDPAERPTISDALNHPFVEARGVEEMLPLRVWQMFEGNFWFNRLDKILQNSLPGQLAIPWIEVQCLVPARSRSPPSWRWVGGQDEFCSSQRGLLTLPSKMLAWYGLSKGRSGTREWKDEEIKWDKDR